MSSSDMHRVYGVVVLVILTVAVGFVLAGCAVTVRDRFDDRRSDFETAATTVLEQAQALPPGDPRAHVYALSAQAKSLTVDGEAWYIRDDGREFVFFPLSVEQPNFHYGYAYSVSGVMTDRVLPADHRGRRDDHWWYGGLSERWLAGAGAVD